MLFQNLANQRLRIFPVATSDVSMSNMPDLLPAFLISLLIERVGMNPNQFVLEVIHPFKKYIDFLQSNISLFPEENFLFFLENSYHSSNYGLEILKATLEILEKKEGPKPSVFVHSLKCEETEARKLMEAYPSLVCFIRTDVEYFFHELLHKKTPIDQIPNIFYRDEVTGEIKMTKTEDVTYDLGDYIVGAYAGKHIFRYIKHPNYVISLLNDDDERTNNKFYYSISKSKSIERVWHGAKKNSMMISTGRWCKYNCIYCYRGVKYSSVRQIPLDILKKDLDILQDMGISSIYLYDDCFLTTNANRLKEIADLLSSYPFEYQTAIRYEMCTPEVLQAIKDVNFSVVQIGMQSASKKTNILIKRGLDIDQFGKILQVFRQRGTYTMVDLILGLPGETIDDFLETLKQALALNPGNITVNTLFLNPGTELYRNMEKYGIVAKKPSLTNVSLISGSSTFPAEDIVKAREILAKMAQKFPHINFIIR